LIYSVKPVLTIALLVEFFRKMAGRSNLFKNRYVITANRLLQMGGNFLKEIKDEEDLRFFIEQTDSRDRNALEIVSQNRFYEMLESF